jgi:hypothetical protein
MQRTFVYSDKFAINYVVLLKRFYDTHKAIIKTIYTTYPTVIRIINGVKQGGILSPFIYNFFVNDLFDFYLIVSRNLGIKSREKIHAWIFIYLECTAP